jgi:5-methylcytosine-specific restriction endonuclease McrA
MTTTRWHRTYSTKQAMGANGRLACLECGGDITAKTRRTFCSPKCSEAFRIKTSAQAVRIALLERDKGICAKCHKDVLEGRAATRRRARGTGHLWQADHILPVVEGGGSCGLENYRTLCTDCHRGETAELARRRAIQSAMSKGIA